MELLSTIARPLPYRVRRVPEQYLLAAVLLRLVDRSIGCRARLGVLDGTVVDVNHMRLPGGDGYGFIHVLASTQIPGALFAPLDLDGTVVRFTARKDVAYRTLQADSRDGLRRSHAYLWFQTYARPVTPCTPDPQIGENCTQQSTTS